MATTQDDIRRWLKEGEKQKATHVIVACDTFDYDDYPVYVLKGQDVNTEVSRVRGSSMQKVMEVYSLTGKHKIEDQINEHRAHHYD